MSKAIVILSGEKLNKAITSLCSSVAKMEQRAHELAVNSLHHFNEHGDTGFASRLVVGLHKVKSGQRMAQGLLDWFTRYSSMEWVKGMKGEAGKFVKDAAKAQALDAEAAYGQAIMHPFFEAMKGEDLHPWDIRDALARILAQAKKRTEDATKGTPEDVIPPSLVAELERVRANYADLDTVTQ